MQSAILAIPKERMKMERPHLVPLSRQAIEILEKIRKITRPKSSDDYLYPKIV